MILSVTGLIMPIWSMCELGEPEVAVGAECDAERLGIGSRNREFRNRVALSESIVPILSAPNSVNQMLPPGPLVIPSGAAPWRRSALGIRDRGEQPARFEALEARAPRRNLPALLG